MSATDELRCLLDERGVKMFHSGPNVTYFETPYGEAQATEYEPGVFGVMMKDLTPEQAIAATLGGGECVMEYATEGMKRGWWVCSECGEVSDTIKSCAGRKPPNYCGNCGKAVKR